MLRLTALLAAAILLPAIALHAQQPDFSKMTPAQIAHWRDSAVQANMKNVKKRDLPNTDKMDNYADAYQHPKSIQPGDAVYSTVQFNYSITRKTANSTETITLEGSSQHAPQYLSAGVTEVIAGLHGPGYRLEGGTRAAFVDYLAHQDNSIKGTAGYSYHSESDDCQVYAQGSELNSADLEFRFDPTANHFLCTLNAAIHVTGTQSDRCTATPLGSSPTINTTLPTGTAASGAIDPASPITYAGVAEPGGIRDGSTITRTSSGYKISKDETHTENGTTVTTSLTVLIGAHHVNYDAILECFALDAAPTLPYDQWLPKGPPKSTPDAAGNNIAFRVYLIDKATGKKITSGPGSSFQLSYTLTSSQLPGVCTNFPVHADKAKEKNDLRFDVDYYGASTIATTVTETSVTSKEALGSVCYAKINCYDYAAYGKLKAHVHLTDESGAPIDLDAHLLNKTATETPIPLDDNNNHIADAWEHRFTLTSTDPSADDDKDLMENNNHNGDGFTLFEEYRGFMINGSYSRLNPNFKELFVINQCGAAINEGLQVFSNASGIKIYQLKNDEIDASDRIVNMNQSEANGGNQHALLYKYGNVKGDEDGSAEPAIIRHLKPATCIYILINQAPSATPIWFTVAHETGHACGITHHGEIIRYENPVMREKDQAFDQSGKPYPTDGRKLKGYWIDASITGTVFSGDVNCLMIYNDRIDWVRFAAGDHSEYRYVPHVPDGKIFCLSAEGTGINADGAANPSVYKHSYFGNAAEGACYKQINVKDW